MAADQEISPEEGTGNHEIRQTEEAQTMNPEFSLFKNIKVIWFSFNCSLIDII